MATEADASTSELVAAQPTNRDKLHRVGGQTEDERVAWPSLAQGTYVYAGRMSEDASADSDILYGPLDGECFTCVLKRVQVFSTDLAEPTPYSAQQLSPP